MEKEMEKQLKEANELSHVLVKDLVNLAKHTHEVLIRADIPAAWSAECAGVLATCEAIVNKFTKEESNGES